MTRRLVTISFTGLNAPGGVPAFNRALHAAFPDLNPVHFCWADAGVPGQPMPEWMLAQSLNEILFKTKRITRDDIIVADGFWAAGLESFPYAISHSHGIWSHLTKEDVDAGKKPDMPEHHAAQVAFRQRWTSLDKPLTAVSHFIKEQMYLQWGFITYYTINNCVDTDKFVPTRKRFLRERPIIVHGVNDRANENKGWRHIENLKDLDAEILSLDEMIERYGGPKEWALSQADFVVHPSGYEGNSMFVAETLSCGVPIVAYNVGALTNSSFDLVIGRVMDRNRRSAEMTRLAVINMLNDSSYWSLYSRTCRGVAEMMFSVKQFNDSWRAALRPFIEA